MPALRPGFSATMLGLAAALAGSPASANLPGGTGLAAPGPRASVPRLAEGRPVLAPFAHVRFCLAHPADCVPDRSEESDLVPMSAAALAELAEVNLAVNRLIRPIAKPEAGLSGAGWAVAPGAGDCNDFAVTKRRRLLDLGWPIAALRLAAVRTASGEGHLVLVVATSRGDLVLDNLRSDIRHVGQAGYEWISVQSAADPRLWRAASRGRG